MARMRAILRVITTSLAAASNSRSRRGNNHAGLSPSEQLWARAADVRVGARAGSSSASSRPFGEGFLGAVFINYRREETSGEARALFNDLVARLGENSVFMDVDNIGLGRDFRQVIQQRLASCELMLALIGKNWVGAKNQSGRRRLDDTGDFVRLEIEAALKRNIPVTPVLLQGAQMPSVEELPESVRDFAYRNGFEISHNRWESDVQEMIKRLGLGAPRSGKGAAATAPAGSAPAQ